MNIMMKKTVRMTIMNAMRMKTKKQIIIIKKKIILNNMMKICRFRIHIKALLNKIISQVYKI
jgi:hypothetical protein